MAIRQQGQFLQADFFDNTGGLNTSDSPFAVAENQATGGRNFEYNLQGGFRKIKGKTKLNSVADSALRTLGLGQHITASGTKTAIRAADRKLQSVNTSTGATTSISDDTAGAVTNFMASSSTIPVARSQFNTATSNVLWLSGGGLDCIYGVYSSTKATKNGAAIPTGTITATRAGAGGGTFLSTGYYRYGIALRKACTQVTSNVTLDKEAQVTVVTDKVTIDLTGLTSLDQTKYDQIWIYRSAVSATAQGNTEFTTGDVIAKLASSVTTYDDTGGYITTATNVPRANSTILDNSVLPAGTFSTIATWKRRLVTSINSTIYISDVNKPESWPTANTISVPSGGPITGLAVISFTTPTSQSIDELLVVFKEREIWVVTGSTVADWSLKYIDAVGCVNQTLIVSANGYLGWIDYRGVYLWDGSAKPIYCSRPIENYFQKDGDIDKSVLVYGWGEFFRANSEMLWVISDVPNGTQKFMLKLDLRLTLPSITAELSGRVLDGVFIVDILPTGLYAGAAQIPSAATDEIMLVGDSAGFSYKMFDALDDAGGAIDFQYETRFDDMGSPGTTKRFNKVIVWTEDTTDADLTLEYWTNYIDGSDEKTTQKAPISKQVREALWDLAYFDAAYWDNTLRGFNPVVFNLSSSRNSIEGDCLKLRFKQGDSNAPLTVAGYTVIFTEVGLRK